MRPPFRVAVVTLFKVDSLFSRTPLYPWTAVFALQKTGLDEGNPEASFWRLEAPKLATGASQQDRSDPPSQRALVRRFWVRKFSYPKFSYLHRDMASTLRSMKTGVGWQERFRCVGDHFPKSRMRFHASSSTRKSMQPTA